MPRLPIDYQKTLIYKIVCNDLNVKDLYVGHTTDFIRRKVEHKSRCNNINKKESNFKIYSTIRENGGWENWVMIEVEKFPCNDAKEARMRERYWFEYFNASLNAIYPKRSIKEWHVDNKEEQKIKSKDYHKKYLEQNHQKIKEKQNEKFACECGGSFSYGNKNIHIKRKKHLNYFEQKQNLTNNNE
jgi:predicted GIY-YIG superfamily endonuclease